jgi:hypothetical protein
MPKLCDIPIRLLFVRRILLSRRVIGLKNGFLNWANALVDCKLRIDRAGARSLAGIKKPAENGMP